MARGKPIWDDDPGAGYEIARIRQVAATATVTESELVTTPESGEWNNFSFYYRPSGSEIQNGNLKADSLTSIYSLRVGDSFEIQYDPKRPSRFYCKEVHSFTRTFGTIMTPAVILFVIALVVSEILGALNHSK